MKITALALCLALGACSLIPDGPPRVTADARAVINRTVNGNAITVLYDTTRMNRPEAELYALQDCEAQGLTLDQVRHPRRSPGQTAAMTFLCRRAFG